MRNFYYDLTVMKAKRDKNIDMLHGPLARKILLFAIPLALTSILQQLLNSADASIAGRFVSSFSLAGIGGTLPITSTFVNLFVGLSIGANVVVAMFIGAGNLERVKETVHTAMGLAVITGIILMIAGLSLTEWILVAIGMPADAEADALIYTRLYFCAIPFLTIYNFGAAILRAHGDARTPLYALIASVSINLALNILFVCGFGWGTAGIGGATIIACALSAALIVVALLHEQEPYRLYPSQIKISLSPLKGILQIGIPAGIQGAVFSLSNIIVQAAINGFGSAAIAGSAATLNFECYTYFCINAFAQTAVTFTSQNFAAGNTERCKTIFRYCLAFGAGVGLTLGITFTALGTTVLSIFTTDAIALGYGMIRMWFIELPDFLTTFYEAPAGCMRGMGWSTLPAIITIFGSCVMRIAFVLWVFPHINDFTALMALYPFTWICMLTAMMIAYFIVRRRAFKKLAVAKETNTAVAIA